jgi:galactokinase
MTGGGFGGCTVNLVESGAVEAFQAAITAGYERRVGRPPGVLSGAGRTAAIPA